MQIEVLERARRHFEGTQYLEIIAFTIVIVEDIVHGCRYHWAAGRKVLQDGTFAAYNFQVWKSGWGQRCKVRYVDKEVRGIGKKEGFHSLLLREPRYELRAGKDIGDERNRLGCAICDDPALP